MAYALLRKKQNHANLSKRKSFIMYVCVHSSEVWQRQHSTIRSVPVQVETNWSTTKGKMLPCFTYVGQLLYVWCIFLLSAKQQRESLEIWKSDSSHSASCEVGYTSVLISLSLESPLGEDCVIFILCWIKSSSYSRMGCLYQMVQQNQIVCFSLVYFCDIFLKVSGLACHWKWNSYSCSCPM